MAKAVWRGNGACAGRAATVALAVLATLLLAEPALAHHPMGGTTPTTAWHGFLSGIGHPVLGPDHFGFIAALGIASAFVPRGLVIAIGFIVASSLGVATHVVSLDVKAAELAVAISVLTAGMAFLLRIPLGLVGWTALAVVAGFFHGFALGESVVGAEQGVIWAYLVGIALVATVIAAILREVTRLVIGPLADSSPRLRAAGALISCLGIALVYTAF